MKLNSSLSAYQPNQVLHFPATLRLSVIQFCAVTGLHDLASECLYVIGIEQDLKSKMLVAACSKGFITVSRLGHSSSLLCVYEQYHQILNTSLLTYQILCMNGIWFAMGFLKNPKLVTCYAFVFWSKCLKLCVHQMNYGSILVSKVYRKRKERRIWDLCSQLMDALREQIISDGLEWVWTQVMLKTHLRTVHISFLSACSEQNSWYTSDWIWTQAWQNDEERCLLHFCSFCSKDIV